MNECFSLKRKKKLVLTGLQQPDITMNMKTPDRELANKELKSLLERAIEALPEKYRLVFVLREIESMSVRDTSELLQIEEPNVKVRLNRAKVMLRDSLGGHMQRHIYHFHLQKCDRMVVNVFARLGI